MTRGATDSRIRRAVQGRVVGCLLAAACLLVGCSGVTQTPFQHRAGEAAGTLAAAAETLDLGRVVTRGALFLSKPVNATRAGGFLAANDHGIDIEHIA